MMNPLRKVLYFSRKVFARFMRDGLDQTSASLAFTTLLSLVPLGALVFSLVSLAPQFSDYILELDRWLVRNLLPERSAGQIAGRLAQFSRKAAQMTVFGVGMMVLTTFLLLNTIERAFNQVWRVRERRPLWQRLILFLIVLVVWPLLLGAGLGALSYGVTASLGYLNEPAWLRFLLFKLLALVGLSGFLAFIYYAVPRAPVGLGNAIRAGILAACGFALLQKGFEAYLAYFPSYTAIYGPLSTVPIFLFWLYLSWAIVLLGAVVTAEWAGQARRRSGGINARPRS